MKKFQLNKDCFFLILIFIVVTSFFTNLFYPELKTIVTPDFGQSDIFQLNVPAKFFLAQNLKNNQLPLWNPYIGNGFPALAEGQTGTFFVINLILFKFLPFPLAFNLGIVSIFLTTAVGMYLFCREIKLSPVSSFFSALTFTFCGFFIGHLTHFNLIQAASLFPLLLFLTLKIIKSVNIRNTCFWGGLFSLTLSQQIFTGFPQMVLITLIWVFLLFFYYVIVDRKIKRKFLLFFLLTFFICLGFLITSVQLIPQYEFWQISTRNKLSETQTSYYSYPFKHLVTFISPFYLGNPKLGTYPPFYEFDGSIFWENTGYIGLIGIFLALLGLFLKFPSKKLFIISAGMSFLLMTGKYSPLYFLYELPLFSLFRVPSRFILPFVFSLSVFGGISFQNLILLISKQKIKYKVLISTLISVALISLQLLDLKNFTWSYHAVAPWKDWLEKPATAEFITAGDRGKSNSKIISLDTSQVWNGTFTTKGWQDITPYYYFRNDLMPNFNTLFKIKQFGVYPVQKTKRFNYFESLVSLGIKSESDKITISSNSARLLKIAGVDYLIAPQKIIFENSQPVFQTSTTLNLPSYNIYSLKPADTFYFTNTYLVASTLEEALSFLSSDKFDPPQNVVLEKDFKIKKESNNKSSANISLIESTNIKNVYNVDSSEEGFLVISQTYYPGWRVFVDGVEKEILPANLNFTAVQLTLGNHQVSFIYKPTLWEIGRFLSLSGILITFLMVFAVPLIFSRRVAGIRSFSAHL